MTLLKGFVKGKLNNIKELEIDKYKFYNIEDLPDNSITNEIMEAALSDNKTAAFLSLNNTYVCVDDGNYKKGTTYKFNGDSWEEISSGGGGIEQLVGTADKPINFAMDMENGKPYIISGTIYFQSNATNSLNTPVLCVKTTDSSVIIYGYNITDFSNVGTFSPDASTLMVFNETGTITKYTSSIAISSLNGRNYSYTPNSIYAPTSAGTTGQILQSNGSGAPTWITPSYATLDDVNNAINGMWEESY